MFYRAQWREGRHLNKFSAITHGASAQTSAELIGKAQVMAGKSPPNKCKTTVHRQILMRWTYLFFYLSVNPNIDCRWSAHSASVDSLASALSTIERLCFLAVTQNTFNFGAPHRACSFF